MSGSRRLTSESSMERGPVSACTGRGSTAVRVCTLMYNRGVSRISVSELRANLKEALARVEAGEMLEVTRDDSVVACLVDPDALRRRARTSDVFEQADRLQREIEEARRRPLKLAGTISK